MQGLQQSYSQYFNLKHRKTGHVFEGRYKAILCQKDEYLLQLIRYIHLNPVRAGMVRSPERYRHSVVSLLEESKQPARYDKESAVAAGWSIHSIPIAENLVPSLDQIHEFMARLTGLPEGTKILLFLPERPGPYGMHGRRIGVPLSNLLYWPS
jgi:hypothetical protein